MRPLVWFRQDLRVRDNTALIEACAVADAGVVGVFVVTPGQWKLRHDWGWPKTDFTLRNVGALSRALEKLNIALRIIVVDEFSGIPSALLELAETENCDALYFNREYEINELDRDNAVTDVFEERGRTVHTFTDLTLVEPGEIRTKEGNWYSVFTPFKKNVLARWNECGVPELVGTAKKQGKMVGVPDEVPGSLDEYGNAAPFRTDLWETGEAAASERLTCFCAERIDSYKDLRDAPAVNGTSTISPYLAAGVLSPRQCLHAAMDANASAFDGESAGAVCWISEILWREFYKHFVVGFPHVVKRRPFKLDTESLAWNENDEHLEAWKQGQTGYPIVDAAMRQLNQTGWMHNRLRMIVAMFLTKDLFLDWRLGEAYFAQKLVDYDFASNNGGWQWSASTGADAAPYFRIYNPASQSKRHDPDGEFIKRFVPELADVSAKQIHEPHAGGGLFAGGYPAPIVNHTAARDHAIAAFKALNARKPVREI